MKQVRVPITLSEEECRQERFAKGTRAQCSSVYLRRSGSHSFCVRGDGHESDHRGYRVQWREES